MDHMASPLRHLFVRQEENPGGGWVVNESQSFLHRYALGYLSPSAMSDLFSQFPFKGRAAGRLWRTEHSPGQPPEETGRQKPQRQLPAPSTCPELSRGPGAHSSSGLGGYHPAVPEEPRNLHPTPPQPLPHKTLLTDFSLHCHDLAKPNQGELSYPLASWSF